MLAGRPLLALAVVWLTTAGHTMNFREMGISKGWVAADVYSLHSLYLVSIALVLLACPAMSQHFSSRGLTRTGLVIMAACSFLNGIYTYAPLSIFLAGRCWRGSVPGWSSTSRRGCSTAAGRTPRPGPPSCCRSPAPR